MLLENEIRPLRVEQGILLRQVAAYLEIDTPMFSKIERGDRRAKRSQVIQMATYFYIFRSISVQSVDDLQYRGKVNTFLKLSPFNSTLSDSHPIPSRQTTAIPHFPPHQESEIHFSTIKTVIL